MLFRGPGNRWLSCVHVVRTNLRIGGSPMKRLLTVIGMFALMAPLLVSAADPLGAPKASLAPGQLALGVDINPHHFRDICRELNP